MVTTQEKDILWGRKRDWLAIIDKAVNYGIAFMAGMAFMAAYNYFANGGAW